MTTLQQPLGGISGITIDGIVVGSPLWKQRVIEQMQKRGMIAYPPAEPQGRSGAQIFLAGIDRRFYRSNWTDTERFYRRWPGLRPKTHHAATKCSFDRN